jgi:hypothetical protein
MLKDLGEATIFSTVNFRSRYWQIPLTDRARKYTACVRPDGGQYAFRVTLFELQGVRRTYMQLVGQEALTDPMSKCYMHYLDDICMYSKNWTEHLQHLALVLECLNTYRLNCALDKNALDRLSLEYRGHIVTATHNKVKPEHVRVVLKELVP